MPSKLCLIEAIEPVPISGWYKFCPTESDKETKYKLKLYDDCEILTSCLPVTHSKVSHNAINDI